MMQCYSNEGSTGVQVFKCEKYLNSSPRQITCHFSWSFVLLPHTCFLFQSSEMLCMETLRGRAETS